MFLLKQTYATRLSLLVTHTDGGPAGLPRSPPTPKCRHRRPCHCIRASCHQVSLGGVPFSDFNLRLKDPCQHLSFIDIARAYSHFELTLSLSISFSQEKSAFGRIKLVVLVAHCWDLLLPAKFFRVRTFQDTQGPRQLLEASVEGEFRFTTTAGVLRTDPQGRRITADGPWFLPLVGNLAAETADVAHNLQLTRLRVLDAVNKAKVRARWLPVEQVRSRGRALLKSSGRCWPRSGWSIGVCSDIE